MSRYISLRALRVLLAICVVAGLAGYGSAQGPSGARLIERIQPAAGRLVIPYSKYVLPNGLTLVVHEDRSDPVVHVDVTYHVGSAREEIGKSGFAHFFEHMMFQGSDNVADDQHFKILTESGGTLNGTTNRDRTNYFETVPNNQLEKALWLEADRMGFLLDAVTQKKFEVQRETVKNERGQNYDNVPYGLAGEMMVKALYPYGHPYSWLTIGYVEDLNRVDVNDLKNFFLRWYGPNNATLTVGGDVDTARVVALTEKYFGSIPRGAAVAPTRLPLPVLAADRYTTLVDNYARQPQLRIAFPSPPLMHPDEAPLDCLAEILGSGKNSIFYQQLVRTQKALNATAANPTSELAGQFTLTVTPAPGVSLAEMKKLVDESVRSFIRAALPTRISPGSTALPKPASLMDCRVFPGKSASLRPSRLSPAVPTRSAANSSVTPRSRRRTSCVCTTSTSKASLRSSSVLLPGLNPTTWRRRQT
jgi:zinc protease